MTTEQHLELEAQQLAGHRLLLTLSPAAVAVPVLSVLVVAAFTLLVALIP
ncbi:hypothetical protein [Amycolatopsis sp. cmx-4-68]